MNTTLLKALELAHKEVQSLKKENEALKSKLYPEKHSLRVVQMRKKESSLKPSKKAL